MLLNGRKQKAVIRFCLTRKNVVESVPLAIFCVYDLEERGGSECAAREKNPTKLAEAKIWGHRARAAALELRPGGSEEGLRPRLDRETSQPGSTEVRSEGGLLKAEMEQVGSSWV